MIEDEDEISIPSSQEEDNEALLRQIKAWFKVDRDHSAAWRKEAREDYEFRDGHQWSDEDMAALKEQNRPIITFNRIHPTIKAVVGLEIGNRREVRFIPREQGDAIPNEILSAAADWVRDECDAEDEDTDAFSDAVTCGMGWTDTRMEYEENPDGMVDIDRIDPLEMFWDASARKKNLADARRLERLKTIPLTEARALYPGFEDADLDAKWAREGKADENTPNHSDPEDAYQGEEDKDPTDRGKEVTILHIQWWEREPYYRIADPFTGEMKDVSEEEHEVLTGRIKEMDGQPLQAVQMTRRVFKQAHVGSKILLLGPAPCDDHFNWECITGERDQVRGTWYGLVRCMKDPQRWANKWLSQGLHILNSNAKGGLMAEVGAFEDDREAEKTWARPDKITWLSQGALTTPGGEKVKPKPPPTFPTGFDRLLELAISSIRDVSGVNLEMLGLKDTQQAGVLEEHRKQAGMTILAGLFDSLRLYRKRQGRILLYFIQTYLSDGRLIRVVGQDKAEYLPLLKAEGLADFDIIVDDSPTSPNQKERIWGTLMQVIPMFGKNLTGEDLLDLMEYSPVPESVVTKWKQKSAEKQQQNAPKQQAMEQLGMEQAGADIEKTKSETALNAAKVGEAQADTQVAAAEAQMVPMKAQAEAEATIIKASHPPVQPAPSFKGGNTNISHG